MTTFQMVISIITVIISFLTLLGFGVFMRNFVDDKHDEKKLNRKLANEKARKERLDEIREVLRSEIKNEVVPLHEEMKTISENVSSIGKTINLLKESVVALDRIVMKMNLDLYKDRGYINSSDRAAWNELFHNYSHLGGNHFKEYVDEWRRTLDILPTKEEAIHAEYESRN